MLSLGVVLHGGGSSCFESSSPFAVCFKKKIIISKGRATSWSSTHDVPLQSWKQHCKWQSLGPWYPSTSTKKSRFLIFFWLRRKKAQENFTFIYLCWTSEKKTPQKHLSHKIPFLSLARWTSPQISIWMLIVRNSNMLSNKDEAWEHRKTKDVDLNKPDHINKSGWEQITRLD